MDPPSSANSSSTSRPASAPPARCKPLPSNAARLLRAEDRFGSIRKGLDATLLLVDGNPLQDISVVERISVVMLKGERIDRSDLFDQH